MTKKCLESGAFFQKSREPRDPYGGQVLKYQLFMLPSEHGETFTHRIFRGGLFGRPPLAQRFPSATVLPKQQRNRLVCLAHRKYGFTLKELSQALGVHYTTLSKGLNRNKN